MFDILFEKPGEAAPEASVCMSARNAARFLQDSLSSILGQQGCQADIIVSDDCSEDDTLAVALELAKAYRGPHAVRVCRTHRRLAIEHRPALATELAKASIIVNADADDISYPHRVARLVALHHETGASMLSGVSFLLDGENRVFEPHYSPERKGWLSLQSVTENVHRALFPAAKCSRRKELFTDFPKIQGEHAAVPGDHIFPFRAWLLKGVWYDDQVLLERRQHDAQWGRNLHDRRCPETADFSWYLHRLACLSVMRGDLSHALATGLVDEQRGALAAEALQQSLEDALEKMLAARNKLNRQHLVPTWTRHEDMAAVNRAPPPFCRDGE